MSNAAGASRRSADARTGGSYSSRAGSATSLSSYSHGSGSKAAASASRYQSRPSKQPGLSVIDGKRANDDASAKNRSAAKSNAAAKPASSADSAPKHSHAFFATALLAVCIAIASVVILYPVAREYYVTVRAHDKVQAEYDAVTARNAKIQEEVDYLNTDAGVEDSARSQLGLVMPGENAVSVPDTGNVESTTTLPAEVQEDSVEAPSNWVTNVLDVVFRVA